MSAVSDEWVLETATLVSLLRERGDRASWASVTADVIVAGSAVRASEQLQEPALLPDQSGVDEAAADVRRWIDHGLTVTTVLDPAYPQRLLGIREVPPLIFTRGRLVPSDAGVSVVGSRKASARGEQVAREVAAVVVERGLTVVSGLAVGIDAMAHRTALACGARTVAVIGTGIRQVYPPEHQALQEEIAEHGLVLSQFWPDAAPTKHSFPMRNATMSGYGLATVVIEASERSGARIQARVAVEHGRPVVLTDLVTRSTEWGRALSTRPGVHVVESASEFADVLDRLRDEQGNRQLLIDDMSL